MNEKKTVYLMIDHDNDCSFKLRMSESAVKFFWWLKDYGYLACDVSLQEASDEEIIEL